MKIIANEIKGVVTSCSVYRPKPDDKSQPHLRIEVLQVSSQGSEIIKIKDNDLSAIGSYQVGSEFCSPCTIRTWSMNGREGISTEVTRDIVSSSFSFFPPHGGEKNEKIEKPKMTV